MWGERRKPNPRPAALLFALCCGIGVSHRLCLGGASGGEPLQTHDAPESEPVDRLKDSRLQRTTADKSVCTSSTECDDGQSCTSDLCSNGVCVNVAVPDCVPCTPSYTCPPIDLVFVMDTSGSMRDEAATLCAGMTQVISDLQQQGVSVHADFLGITQTPGGSFSCLTDHVVGLLGGDVPGDAAGCPFPNGTSSYESWGPAAAIIAQRFNWTPGAVRLVIPMSDEGPCDGSLPEGCNDPGDDRDSIVNAIAIALANNVVVSPISGSGSDSCVLSLTGAIASGTGGIALQSKDPTLDLFDAVNQIVLNLCEIKNQCDDQRPCTSDDRCRDGVCVGTPIDGCRSCAGPTECDDQNACTTDYCIEAVCSSTVNYETVTQCCNPMDGVLTMVDDGDPCTRDVCNPATGRVDHPPAPEGTICNDGIPCTLLDECDATGLCSGIDAGNVPCASDADCFGLACDLTAGYCACPNSVPEICLNATPGNLPDGSCFSVGEDVFVTVELGSSLRAVVGGQFLIKYDPTVLDFIAIHPGAVLDSESPFGLELLRSINEVEGTIFYAVGVSLGAHPTHDPVKMAWLRFRSLQACATDELCFLSENPANSILVDDQGLRVPFTTCCTGELYIRGSRPVLTCPASVSRNALAGRLYADVGWAPMLATSECDGALQVECHGVNEAGIQFESLIPTGGRFPLGQYEFECTATDSCSASTSCRWSVEVGGTNSVEVDVQLSAVMTTNLISRCIEFEFFGDCSEPPVVVQQTLDFGGLFNFPGTANNVILKVPHGNYGCVTARDPRHTLRSVALPEIIDGKYVLEFKGDPTLQGNWLINGNLNGDHVIDLLDHALLLAQYSAALNPNTPCGTGSELHADLNGNGSVDSGDLGFIQRNFLVHDKGACCSTTAGETVPSEPSEISLEELDSLGLSYLRDADSDENGMVTAEEILSYLHDEPPADQHLDP